MVNPSRSRGESEKGEFCSAVCDGVLHKELDEGPESLSVVERVVFEVHVFRIEHGKGCFSGYFYSTLPDRAGLDATIAALRAIAADRTSAIFAEAAALLKPVPKKSKAPSWPAYLAQVDPKERLAALDTQLAEGGEDLAELLEAYVFKHRTQLDSLID